MATTLQIGDRGPEVERLQVEINKTLARRRFDWRQIDEDQILGDETRKAARFVGWLMGLTKPRLDKIDDGTITSAVYAFLVGDEPPTDAMTERITARKPMAKKLRFLHRRKARRLKRRGEGEFDGVPVAAWIVPLLTKSRANGWQGVLVSGYRTPEHSQALCRDICGQPSCPGRCAGTASRHVGLIFPAGAIDVTDTDRFAAVQKKIGSPLFNDLPNDPVHFSATGH